MGAHSCGPLRSHVNSFLDFCFAFRIPAFLYKICFAFLCAPAFLFHVPLLLCQRAYIHMRGGWGATPALCVYGRIRRARSTCHQSTTPLRHACAVYSTSILAGSRFGWGQTCVSSTIPHSTSPLSTLITVSSRTQKRKFSIPILSLSAFPCSCLKFAFPLAAFLKTLEHRNVGMGNQDCVPISSGWHASWKLPLAQIYPV